MNIHPAQLALEAWFDELGIDMSTSETLRITKRMVEALDLKGQADELAGVLADIKNSNGFDQVCQDTIQRVHDNLRVIDAQPT